MVSLCWAGLKILQLWDGKTHFNTVDFESSPKRLWHNLQIYERNCSLLNNWGENKRERNCVSLGITFPSEKAIYPHSDISAIIPMWGRLHWCLEDGLSFHSLAHRHLKLFKARTPETFCVLPAPPPTTCVWSPVARPALPGFTGQ